MARIRLYVRQSLRTSAELLTDNRGEQFLVPFLRVYGHVRMGERTRYAQDCIVDTGAPLTIFPVRQWKHFADEIEWLSPSSLATASWLTHISGKTGGECPCRIGYVLGEPFDLGPPLHFLKPSKILAFFEEAPSGDDQIIVGLHAGILAGRRLIVEPSSGEAYLEDA